MSVHLEIILIACTVSMACVLPGVYLVLRKVALMSDAISHAILLGIVVAFFAVKNLHSPWLIIGATLAGILTVTLTELLINSRRIKKDAAIGLIFPVFFSIGVILINRYAGNVHLDNDAVLLGEIAYAPFNRFFLFGTDVGPLSLWTMIPILILNIGLISLFYKELKVASFDKGLAASLGFAPSVVHYGLMTSVSITSVGAFDTVGSILVVALMITPPATAYLLTERVSTMIIYSVIIGLISSILGYWGAILINASIAGTIATMTGVCFLLALFFSPQQGLLFKYLFAKKQKMDFAVKMLLVQLLDHENTPQEKDENTVTNMTTHMDWPERFAKNVCRLGIHNGFITREGNLLKLTALGRESARNALTMS